MRARQVLRLYSDVLLVTVLVALFARTFLVQGLRIASGSMEDSLLSGDHVLVNKLIFADSRPTWLRSLMPLREIERGEILVFRYPEDPRALLVKRCIALPGEEVVIRQGAVLVNGRVLDESAYLSDGAPESSGGMVHSVSLTVPPGHYFVLGDRREISYDSRAWGPVSREYIEGKPFLIYWSFGGSEPPGEGSVPDLHHLVEVARNFSSGTRWDRVLRTVM